ncbi:conserved hypothetical protein [Trichinella spiralis]|uniref:FZ domain-containing protein n=1 Tax=Trichinella spiralis TaxID=6334 RepID=E5SIZ1_TRISP|nr:conserved hypothetical protein [Trichinella spiralis]KRY27065.1 hypothetical protein T01_3861 [Trichinella spiralis]KRY27067.1 hypothetical protein T01_8708 [Trichinella spiralis]
MVSIRTASMDQKLFYATVLAFFLLSSAKEENYNENNLPPGIPLYDFVLFNRNISMDNASCYDMYTSCPAENLITPYAVSHSNIILFCSQIEIYKRCFDNISLRYDVMYCLYKAYISEDQENFEVQLLSTAFRIYYFMCMRNSQLVKNWDRPLCFAQKFHDCVSVHNATECVKPCPDESELSGAYPSSISSFLQTVMAVTTSIAVARMMVI